MAFNTPLANRRASALAQSTSIHRSPQVRPSQALSRRESSVFFQSEAGSNNGDVFPDAALGDKVEVPGGWHGFVMYVGGVEGRSGVFLGVDLIELDSAKGRNDGSYKGVKYFNTKKATSGMFVPQGKCRIIKPATRERNGSIRQYHSKLG